MLLNTTIGRVFGAVLLLSGLALTAQAQDKKVRFDGHAIIRAEITSEQDLNVMLGLSPDIWSHAMGIGPVDFRIPPEAMDDLNQSGIAYTVLIANVQVLIDRETAHEEQGGAADGEWYLDYKTYDEINARLAELTALRPDLVEPFEVGVSHEGRPIYGIRITSPTGSNKPGILYNGCQHAREWISPMSTMFLADTLVRNYDTDPRVADLLNTLEFFIVPVSNPDGFNYTWTNYRLWRKNRRDNGDGTFGVDINRNWGYEWGGIGSSGNPSSDLYRGPDPFSEPETASLRDFIIDHPNIVGHVDIHSYSQLVLYPWCFTPDPSPHHEYYVTLGEAAADAIYNVHGKTYVPGTWYDKLYPSTGTMIDWVYGERGAYSFTYELRDTGQYGFLLPADQIIPTAEEVFEGLLVVAEMRPPIDMMLDVSALAWNETATLRSARSTPNEMVYFAYTFAGEGETYVPPLGITLGLSSPNLAGSSRADADGYAWLSDQLPSGRWARLIWFQSAEAGRTSNVVGTQIN